MASLLQEERDFQEELDDLDMDNHRQRVQEDIGDFISGSPRRSTRREREESQKRERAYASPQWQQNGHGWMQERRDSESPAPTQRRQTKPESRNGTNDERVKEKEEVKEKEKEKEKEKVEDENAEEKKGGFLQAISDTIDENKAAYAELEKKVASVSVGSRVRRNDESWQWGDQDGGEKNFGTVLGVDTTMGWVTVRWDPVDNKKGKKNNYRWGQDKGGVTYWDVELAPNAPPAPPQPSKEKSSA
eukprot:TRINITY_DN1598_c2_g1_i2.p2 TRINITY_DN1598_c2_g1~~TRINITY_DN1598_c2_g1_i2.p2  ORF type:complete len:245 (+),score=90.78 TRINITY_DN1598_c2_g1_i2:60-794(+)